MASKLEDFKMDFPMLKTAKMRKRNELHALCNRCRDWYPSIQKWTTEKPLLTPKIQNGSRGANGFDLLRSEATSKHAPRQGLRKMGRDVKKTSVLAYG